ncbi:MAG: AMP-dependent synthetase/ligase [Proteobacteria bacterium]|nr:AMP-dependent synthetase/ligase [Pseudomonadota bacterium]
MRADTIPARLMNQLHLRPAEPAYHVKTDRHWRSIDWQSYVGQVRRAGKSLMAMGLGPGDKVAMLGFNRPEWVIFHLGAMCIGAAGAGIYAACSAEEIQYIAAHAEARVVLLQDGSSWQKIADRRGELPRLEHVILMADAPHVEDRQVMSWADFDSHGDGISDAEFDQCIDELEPESLAALIYTSGATGPPRGVMLSHSNLTWASDNQVGLLKQTDCDRILSYLPLSHIAEQTLAMYCPITVGAAVYYAESLAKVSDNLREVEPTILFGLPRIWEKYHAAVQARLARTQGIKRALIDWVRRVGTRVSERQNCGRSLGALLTIQYKLASYLIFTRLKKALGLRHTRVLVSGAGSISRQVIDFFASLDLVIHEQYGQSESCGPTSFNRIGETRFGTVGKPIDGVEAKIAQDGEILVRGPNLFMGYYRDELATSNSLVDGWLRTGDVGEIDSDGYLKITGRKKNIFIANGGNHIAPESIEAALKDHPLIGEAVVIGDRRPFLSALLALDEEVAGIFVAERGLPEAPIDQIVELRNAVQDIVEEVNRHRANGETIKRFKILPHRFTVESGELTATLNVKRRLVTEKYAREIDAMYVDVTVSDREDKIRGNT